MAMALDEPKEDDFRLEKEGINFFINQDLLKSFGPVTVEYNDDRGYKIASKLDENKSCGGGCSSC
ncbi:MAG: hypothetical protein JW884_04865 [Deltaproteobacteria bacterium]|nr:hypothetical protein [Deltaproteobacteria bacterium]